MDSIIFLRHGQAENNTKRMLSGRSPGVPLTAKGLEQAQNTARFLNGHKIAHIYSSPIERAHETARIAAEHNNVSLTVDERLTELDMGSFTGSKYDEIMEKHGNVFLKFYQNDPEIPKYGVETFDNLKKRVLDMVEYVYRERILVEILLKSHHQSVRLASD